MSVPLNSCPLLTAEPYSLRSLSNNWKTFGPLLALPLRCPRSSPLITLFSKDDPNPGFTECAVLRCHVRLLSALTFGSVRTVAALEGNDLTITPGEYAFIPFQEGKPGPANENTISAARGTTEVTGKSQLSSTQHRMIQSLAQLSLLA